MCFSVSALTVSDTYSDVSSTSSQAVNLVNYAASYDSFVGSDFVIFCDVQNSHYIVWGDLDYSNGIVSGTDVELVHYYRPGGTNTSYVYVYGTDNSFALKADNVCTSNIDNYGFMSAVYEEYKLNDSIETSLIFIIGFLFVIMILRLRRD